MITSLLEPCLIISNYPVRHLVHSMSFNTQPEQQPTRRSVCSVTLVSSMSMRPHLCRLQRQDQCCCINNTDQEGVYSVSAAAAFFLSFVTQFTQTQSMERFRLCMWSLGTTCTYCGRKIHHLQEKGLCFAHFSCQFSYLDSQQYTCGLTGC